MTLESQRSPETVSTGALRRVLFILAAAMVVGATGIAYAGFIRAPGFRAPAAIAYVLALICIVTAARLVELASGHIGTGDWFALVFFGASAVVTFWISLWADPRGCTSSISILTGPGGNPCRVPFGIAGGICTGLSIYCGWRLLHSKLR
ncbi:MAG TPA: hypothetical protein VE110_02760 [Gemmatimonadaceae bacterium]|nr:hypothetical protein [Gemmatimonadaceae bacterium]